MQTFLILFRKKKIKKYNNKSIEKEFFFFNILLSQHSHTRHSATSLTFSPE